MTSSTPSSSDSLAQLLQRLQQRTQRRPQVLISACLAGQNVRYDGQQKSLGQVLAPLAEAVELIQHCPEMDAGMGVPRAPIQWVQTDAAGPQLQWVDAADTPVAFPLRDKAEHWCRQHPGLTAAILKARSPSCGHGTTPVMDPTGQACAWIDGVFTDCLKQSQPQLAIVDESYFGDEQTDARAVDRTRERDLYWFVFGVYLAQLRKEGAPAAQTLSALTPWNHNLSQFLATAPSRRDWYMRRVIHSVW